MKVCSMCKEEKGLDMFNKRKASKDGLSYICSKCNIDYRREPLNKIREIYKDQVKNSKKRTINEGKKYEVQYTQEEFIEWVSNTIFLELHENWKQSGYLRELAPSVDRIYDYKDYKFGNIQLMTCKENEEKSYSDKINGLNNKQSKAIIQLDKDGNIINEFYSMHEASRQTGINRGNIGSCCNGKLETAGGYKWCFS